MKWNLIDAEGRDVVTYVMSQLPYSLRRSPGEERECRGWRTQAIRRSTLRRDNGCRYRFRAVSDCRIASLRWFADPYSCCRIRAEFIYASEVLLEWMVAGKMGRSSHCTRSDSRSTTPDTVHARHACLRNRPTPPTRPLMLPTKAGGAFGEEVRFRNEGPQSITDARRSASVRTNGDRAESESTLQMMELNSRTTKRE
jgi:hypothetical protein